MAGHQLSRHCPFESARPLSLRSPLWPRPRAANTLLGSAQQVRTRPWRRGEPSSAPRVSEAFSAHPSAFGARASWEGPGKARWKGQMETDGAGSRRKWIRFLRNQPLVATWRLSAAGAGTRGSPTACSRVSRCAGMATASSHFAEAPARPLPGRPPPPPGPRPRVPAAPPRRTRPTETRVPGARVRGRGGRAPSGVAAGPPSQPCHRRVFVPECLRFSCTYGKPTTPDPASSYPRATGERAEAEGDTRGPGHTGAPSGLPGRAELGGLPPFSF